MATVSVEIVSPDGRVWSGAATYVRVPGSAGSFGVLPGHQSVAAILDPGTVQVRPRDTGSFVVDIDGGFVFVDHDHVTILASGHAEPTARE